MIETNARNRFYINSGISLLLLVVASVICWYFVTYRTLPTQYAFKRLPPMVKVQEVVLASSQVPVVGHGSVRAKRQVSVVPEVTGKLVYAHPDLAQGRVIAKGEVLFQIDDKIYESRKNQVEAEIRRLQLQLESYDRQSSDLENRIATAQKLTDNAKEIWETAKKAGAAIREVEVLADEQRYLLQKDALDELISKQAMIPLYKRDVEAQLEAAHSRLVQATHDLDNTTIRCPFHARVDSITAQESQVVTAFFTIATLTDLSAFEIAVGIDPRDVQWLQEEAQPALLENGESITKAAVTIRSRVLGLSFSWKGHVTRFERVDETTRTARIVVEVRHEDMMALNSSEYPAEHIPKLAIGLFCEVELPPRSLQNTIVISRRSLYQNELVYVFEPDKDGDERSGRLGVRKVSVLRSLGDDVLVSHEGAKGHHCELAEGDIVIVSPLARPVVGMPIRLREEDIRADVAVTRDISSI